MKNISFDILNATRKLAHARISVDTRNNDKKDDSGMRYIDPSNLSELRQCKAHECEYAPRFVSENRGWFGDPECSDMLFYGVVYRLPHGRFIAGINCEDIDGMSVIDDEIFDNQRDAAIRADECARIIAEKESEYQEKQRAADKLDSLIEDKARDVCDCRQRLQVAIAASLALLPGTASYMKAWKMRADIRAEAREIVADIRKFIAERQSINV